MDPMTTTRQDPSASQRRRGRHEPVSPLPQQPNLGVLLFVASRSMEVRILEAVVAAGYPVTMAQSKVFQRIADDGSRLTELAAAAEVTKQTAGYLVDQLEERGYVERVPDPRDARARLVRLTALGRDIVEVARPVQQSIEAEWVEHLGLARAQELYATLAELRTITDPYA